MPQKNWIRILALPLVISLIQVSPLTYSADDLDESILDKESFVLPNNFGLLIQCDTEALLDDPYFRSFRSLPAEMAETMLVKAAPQIVVMKYFDGSQTETGCAIKPKNMTGAKVSLEGMRSDEYGLVHKASIECDKDLTDAYLLSKGMTSHPMFKNMLWTAIQGAPVGSTLPSRLGCGTFSGPPKAQLAAQAKSLVGLKSVKNRKIVAKPKTAEELFLEELEGKFSAVDSQWRQDNGALVGLTIREFWFGVYKGSESLRAKLKQYKDFKSSGELKSELSAIGSDAILPSYYIRYKDPKFQTEFEAPIFRYLSLKVENGSISDPGVFAGVFYYVWSETHDAVTGGNYQGFMRSADADFNKITIWTEQMIDDALAKNTGLDDVIARMEATPENVLAATLNRFNSEYPQIIRLAFSGVERTDP